MILFKGQVANPSVILLFSLFAGVVGNFVAPINVSAQTKEEVFDIYRLESGAHKRSNSDFNSFWLKFGTDYLNELKYDERSWEKAVALEAVLEPYVILKKAHEDAIGTDADDATAERLYAFECSGALTQEIFDIFGPDYCLKKVAENLRHRMLTDAAEMRRDWFQLVSELDNDRFAAILDLSTDQKKQIQTETETWSRMFKQKAFAILDELSVASDRRWRRLLGELNNEQRKTALQLIGVPVEWFRELNDVSVRSELAANTGGYGARGRAMDISNENDVSPETLMNRLLELPLEKLEGLGLDVFDSLEWAMFQNKSIHRELELVDKQENDLQALHPRIDKQLFYRAFEGRFQELLDGNARVSPVIRDVLLPKQIELFHQIELQIRLDEKFDSTVGLLDPRMADHLALSKDQKNKLAEIGEEFAIEMQRLLKKIPELQKQYNRNLYESLAGILNDSQHEKFTHYTGHKLTK